MLAGNDNVGTFENYARIAGARVSVVTGYREAAAAILQGLDGRLTLAAGVREFYPALYKALEESGVPFRVAEDVAEHEPNRSALAAELAGGTGVVIGVAGVAETGSLALANDALAPRLLSMLADVCVALLPASAIVPSLDEAGALLGLLNEQGHRYVSLVTGPSRTADIERVLTIGVQGPRVLHIVVFQ